MKMAFFSWPPVILGCLLYQAVLCVENVQLRRNVRSLSSYGPVRQSPYVVNVPAGPIQVVPDQHLGETIKKFLKLAGVHDSPYSHLEGYNKNSLGNIVFTPLDYSIPEPHFREFGEFGKTNWRPNFGLHYYPTTSPDVINAGEGPVSYEGSGLGLHDVIGSYAEKRELTPVKKIHIIKHLRKENDHNHHRHHNRHHHRKHDHRDEDRYYRGSIENDRRHERPYLHHDERRGYEHHGKTDSYRKYEQPVHPKPEYPRKYEPEYPRKYEPGYPGPEYPRKYEPEYPKKYELGDPRPEHPIKFEPEYPRKYEPEYPKKYESEYPRKYEPDYPGPGYSRKYEPEYSRKYEPEYPRKYEPGYPGPGYSRKYEPEYPRKYEPEFPKKYELGNPKPEYVTKYETEYPKKFEPGNTRTEYPLKSEPEHSRKYEEQKQHLGSPKTEKYEKTKYADSKKGK